MKKIVFLARMIVCAGLFTGLTAFAADVKPMTGKIPGTLGDKKLADLLFDPASASTPVAKVNDEVITIGDLQDSLSMLHEGMSDGAGQHAKKQDFAEVLNRLVNSRVLIQEARNMGIDQLPEVKDVVESNTRKMLREKLMTEHVKDVKVDEAEVEKEYRGSIVQWKLRSLVFKDEAKAKKAEKEFKKGKDFSAIYDKAVNAKDADGTKDEAYLGRSSFSPGILKILVGLKKGEVSPVMPLEKGYLILKIDDVKTTEDPQTMEKVRHQVLTEARLKALKSYRDELIKKHVKEDKKLLDSLDFEAKEPGFEKLAKDQRVIAEVPGTKPVTIMDLAQAMQEKFFHGVDTAIKDKKLNKAKEELLLKIYSDRVLEKEALVQGIDKRKEVAREQSEFADSVMFGAFIERVVRPDVKMSGEELQAYYKEHLSEYTYPEMYKIDGIAFATGKDADAAIEKLRKGMDYKWFTTNAEGRVSGTPKLTFDGNLIMKSQLPEGLQKALTGVKAGEYRRYDQDKEYYVLNILDVVPSREQPFQDVEDGIKKKIYFDKLNKAVESWATKLREGSDIKIFVEFKN